MPEYSKNQLLRHDDRIIRVLTFDVDVLIIDCLKRTMPQWMPTEELQDWVLCDETALPLPEAHICNIEELTPAQRKVMHERYTLIAPVLPFIHKDAQRSAMITQMAELNNISKQTIRKYLCLFLTYQRMEVLAPPAQRKERELTKDEKNFRWAINKFFYTQRKHSLSTAYNLMLKAKYTDDAGQLFPDYPPFHRFKYYYQRHRSAQTELISRDGKTNYQRNSRALLGSIQDFAPSVGTAMLDSTICDIYLVNDANQLIGRPVLTLAVDAYGKSYVSKKGIILDDKKAEQIWEAQGFPLKGKSKSKWLAYYMGTRSAVFDEWLAQQMANAPNAVVIHIGCGLDSRCVRVGTENHKWYDVDFSEVIGERKRYYAESDNYKMIAGDARDCAWLTAIKEKETAIVVMEGVSMYLTVDEMRNLADSLCNHFENLMLLVDAYTSFAAKMSKRRNPINDVGVTEVYGIDNPQTYQCDELAFVKEHAMTPQKYIDELKGFEKFIFAKLYAGSFSKKLYRLFEYQKR